MELNDRSERVDEGKCKGFESFSQEKLFTLTKEEERMKQEKEKKLRLGKETIQDLDTAVLDRDEQKRVNGGTGSGQRNGGTTEVPVFC